MLFVVDFLCSKSVCEGFWSSISDKSSGDFENVEVSRGGYLSDFRTIWPGLAYVWGSTHTQWHFPYSFVLSTVK